MNKKIFSLQVNIKKILFVAILLAVTIIPASYASAASPSDYSVYGWQTQPPPEHDASECWSWSHGFTFSNCVAQIMATVVNAILGMTARIVWVASASLNFVLAMQGTAFHNQPLVNVGWQIARDVANLFYIFFLLIIAIAMILGISSYGSKQTLVKLLISAVFVNFSLPLTGIVIDASNALAYTFYNQMGAVDPNLANTSTPPYNRDIGAALAEGFNPQKVVGVNNNYFQGDQQVTSVLLDIVLAGVVGTILMLIMAFALFAGAFLLMVRIIVLWMVLVFSPIAFASVANPRTEGLIFNKWSDTLFRQSFFFPAYMFMLYLVVTAVSGGVVTSMFQQGNNALYGTSAANAQLSAWTSRPNILLGFIFIAMLTIGSLTVAGQMGAYGSSTVNAMKARSKKLANQYLRQPIERRAKQLAGRAVAPVGAAAVRSGIPLARSAGAAAVRYDQRQKEEQAKRDAERAKYLNPREKAIMARGMSSAGIASVWKDMKPKERAEFLKEYSKNDRAGHVGLANQLKLATRDESLQKKYNQEVAIASGNLNHAMQILGHGDKSPEELKAAKHNFLVDMEDNELKSFLSPDAIKSDVDIQTYVTNNFTLGDLRKYADGSDKLKAYAEVINNPQFANSSLVKKIGSSPSKTIIQQKLAAGELLTEVDTGTPEKKSDEEKKKKEEEKASKIAGAENTGGGARTTDEQQARSEEAKDIPGNNPFEGRT